MVELVIVVPCFNEGRRLRAEGFRPLLSHPGTRILFVDDGSRDDTREVLASVCAQLGPRALRLDLARNQGKAEAVRQGLLEALQMGARMVGFLDADLATPAEEMLRLISTLRSSRAQAAFAARVALLGTTIERHATRHYLGRVFATAASLILDLRVYDTQCGAKAFHATPLLAAALEEPFHARWAFDVELIGRLLAGAPGIPGLRATDLLEMPLRTWTDVPDSKLRFMQFPQLGIELARIHFALGRQRASAAARGQAGKVALTDPPAAAGRAPRRPWAVPALFAVIVALRSAGFVFGVLNIDESDFAVIAKRMLQGAVPFAEIADIKPPLAYLPFTSVAMFGGLSILPVHILGVFWVLATCLVLGRAARRLTGSEVAAAAAPWLALLASQCELPSVSTELLMALPAAGALLFHVRAETGGSLADVLLAGVCIGGASLIRQQGGILLAAFGLALCWQALRNGDHRRLLRLLPLAAGFALPWAFTVMAFAKVGALSEFWDWVVARNVHYGAPSGPRDAFLLAAQAVPLCVGGAIVPWMLATRETIRPTVRGPARTGLVLALWLTWISVSVGGRFYEHYFLQFVAPLALLASPQAAALVQSWPAFPRARRALVVLACAFPALIVVSYSFGRGIAGRYPEQEPHARALAGWLARNTTAEERLFIWGHYSPIYFLAGRLPGTRYVTTSVHVGNFDPEHLPDGFDLAAFRSDRDVAFTLKDLETNRVAIFVDTAPAGIHHWERVPLSVVPALDRYLHEHYALVADVAGSRVYRRLSHGAGRP